MITHITIAVCDPLNEALGYSIRIEKHQETLLFTDRHPVTGGHLLTLADVLDVAAMYADPSPVAAPL
jgi:hypothetical protein